MKSSFISSAIQKEFLESTAKKIKSDLEENHPKVLDHFVSTQKDGAYHFWKRRPLSIDLYSPKVFEQTLEYIHNNPVNAGICAYHEDYVYSSARFYLDGTDIWEILTHHND